MKLTSFTDYSLRVLIFLAARPERRATIAEIATAFEVSEHHLTKVVHFLGKEGWLATVRGKGGGIGLACSPDAICVGQVIRRTEGAVVAAQCFDDGTSHCVIAPVCRLRGVLAEAISAFYKVLDNYTLADLVTNRDQLVQALFFESPASIAARKAAP